MDDNGYTIVTLLNDGGVEGFAIQQKSTTRSGRTRTQTVTLPTDTMRCLVAELQERMSLRSRREVERDCAKALEKIRGGRKPCPSNMCDREECNACDGDGWVK